jgi:outer membrane protein assembly factor BamB
MLRAVIVSGCLIGMVVPTQAGDWPQFLGPNRDNGSPEIVAAWSGAPEVLWRQPVGDAHSSPVVADGRVFAFYQPRGKNADALAAFDAATGKKLWESQYDRPAFTPPFGTGPRGTPTVSGDTVFTLGSTGILAAWNVKDGNLRWKVDTLTEFAAKNLFFGISTSPTIVGNQVIVMVGGEGAGVVAFDKATGKTLWKATDDPQSYATPIVTEIHGKPQVILLTGAHLLSLSPTGTVLWKFPFRDRLNESSTTPVRVGNQIIASSVTAGSVAVEIPASGTEVKPVWKDPKLTCYFSTPVLVGKELYMINGAATLLNPTIVLRCVEAATGKILWEKPNLGKYHAAIIRTGDNKLLMLDDTGRLTLFQPSTTGFEPLAEAKVCGPTWAHPALADGRLILRDEKELIALKLGR